MDKGTGQEGQVISRMRGRGDNTGRGHSEIGVVEKKWVKLKLEAEILNDVLFVGISRV